MRGLASGLYEGHVRHRRLVGKRHEFTYRLFMPLVDLSELEEMVARHPLWGSRRRPVWFRRADYLGDPGVPLEVAVRHVVMEETGDEVPGPIRMLAHLRTWGWCFNPIAVYYCYDMTGTEITHLVLSVTNTPWNERHNYVFRSSGKRHHEFRKALHVSPFMDMDHDYRVSFSSPGDGLALRFENHREGEVVFDADLVLRRRPFERSWMTRMMLRHPAMTAKVSAAIYFEALRLLVKRVPFVPNRRPSSRTPEGVR